MNSNSDKALGEDFLHNAAGASCREVLFLTVVAVDELPVIETEKVQEGRLVIVRRHNVHRRLVADVVRFTVDDAGLHAAAGQPQAEPLAVVIAAALVAVSFSDRQPPDLSAPVDER